ncbi:hypothetical protein J6TS7_01860 [Paenibacillus dendritiformis]|nr:hypothetical protein J6TS7_01860 [Paenibacillus dendritiformis]
MLTIPVIQNYIRIMSDGEIEQKEVHSRIMSEGDSGVRHCGGFMSNGDTGR